MSRRRKTIKRGITPDPKYNSELVAKVIRSLMRSGKKTTSERIVYGAIAELGENGIPFGIIYTKCDKQGPNVLAAQIARDEELLLQDWEELPPSFRSSSSTGMGREEILGYIDNVLANHNN